MKRGFAAFLITAIFLLAACQQGGTAPKAGGALQITTKSLPNWEAGNKATFKISVTGGTPPYSYSLAAGSQLPQGFTLGPDGTIGGTATLSPGTSKSVSPPFTITVTDSTGASVQQSYSINIVEKNTLQINTLQASCAVKQKCDAVIATASGGNPPYTFQSDTFANGAPPFGTIVDVNGHLTGTPSKEGQNTVGVCVKDTTGNSRCGTAVVTITGGGLDGTWSGSYDEAESFPDEGELKGCSTKNTGTLIWVLTTSGNSFSGTVDDSGAAITSTCEIAANGYHITGTVTGTVSGNAITGTMLLDDGTGGSWNLPVSGTVSGSTITATYTGTGIGLGPPTVYYSGSFTLQKQS